MRPRLFPFLLGCLLTSCGDSEDGVADGPGKQRDGSVGNDAATDGGWPGEDVVSPDSPRPPEDAPVPEPDATPTPEDDAAVATTDLPSAMACGESRASSITFTNTGRSTWTAATGYGIGSASGSADPFTNLTGAPLPDGVSVAPGEPFTFAGTLVAPSATGTYETRWRMSREGAGLFGAVAGGTITVTCTPAQDSGTCGNPTLPPPDGRAVVNAVAADRPDLLQNSCVEQGGNNDFMFEVVRRLRQTDARYGLNWKRGNVGDLSQDVVDYYHGPGAAYEGATEVYIFDIIGGHCGPSPSPAWTDVTQATCEGGAIGRWTLAGRTDL
jgi:hypothetical protein